MRASPLCRTSSDSLALSSDHGAGGRGREGVPQGVSKGEGWEGYAKEGDPVHTP